MLDVSWGELLVLSAVGISLVGRRDLPKVSRLVGTQVGRVVGLLQGARARADRFTAQNELRQLQNELRAGLRELDAVKSEMAVAASGPVGIVGRSLGATVAGVNRQPTKTTEPLLPNSDNSINPTLDSGGGDPRGDGSIGTVLPTTAERSSMDREIRELAPRSQAVAAVAEEEWEKQGIGFQSRAERGDGTDGGVSGSTILANLLQQSLIHDQYDRTVREQDQALQSRAQRVREQAEEANKDKKR